jgi:hypothetical protein
MPQDKKVDQIKLNKEIAYKGEIGEKRKEFCQNYIKKKQEAFKQIEADQQRTVAINNETISCHDHCPNCCYLFMQANLQECEAAVYYLYQNEEALSVFLKNYTQWREKLKENNDIFKECASLWFDKVEAGAGPEKITAFEEAATRYQQQLLPCPFLHNASCMVYEVRPYLCAGTVATTPSEYCNPKSEKKSVAYKTQTSALFDKSFYFGEIEGYVFAFFPMTVYDILSDGYKAVARMAGIKDLEEKAMAQPEVKKALKALSRE